MRLISVAVLLVAAAAAAAHAACPGQRLRAIPADPGARGPWPVGLRSVQLTDRNFTVDILYPAQPGSETGEQQIVYSLRDNYMPPRQAAKIPDEDDPPQPVEAFRDLPLDQAFGPYPVHIHIHGTAGFRSASAHQLTHMASRGFIVAAGDHPGLNLGDMMRLGNGKEVDLTGDFYKILDELDTLVNPDLQFLRGYINTTLLAASGHSAGGSGVRPVGDRASVIMPMATSGGVTPGAALKSVLVLAGNEDGVANYEGSLSGYERAPSPKRFVGLNRAGHLFCTDLCWIGEEDGGLVQIAIDHGIYIAYLFAGLGTDGCDAGQVKNDPAWDIVNFAMAAAQEELLHCNAAMAEQLRQIESLVPNVFEYRESL